jgi:hypothetical protein
MKHYGLPVTHDMWSHFYKVTMLTNMAEPSSQLLGAQIQSTSSADSTPELGSFILFKVRISFYLLQTRSEWISEFEA